jgi:hypothetical protein
MSSNFPSARGILVVAIFVGLTGCTANRIWDVSTSPDGRRVEVVGAVVNQFNNPPTAVKPLRWVCLRGTDDRLNCQQDTSTLPKVD